MPSARPGRNTRRRRASKSQRMCSHASSHKPMPHASPKPILAQRALCYECGGMLKVCIMLSFPLRPSTAVCRKQLQPWYEKLQETTALIVTLDGPRHEGMHRDLGTPSPTPIGAHVENEARAKHPPHNNLLCKPKSPAGSRPPPHASKHNHNPRQTCGPSHSEKLGDPMR